MSRLPPVLDLMDAARSFAALGSEQRLQVLHALVAAGPDGLPAGALAQRVGLGASTLTHHLRILTQAGLVTQRKVGRSVISSAAYDRVTAVSDYLLLNCCAEVEPEHNAAPDTLASMEHGHE